MYKTHNIGHSFRLKLSKYQYNCTHEFLSMHIYDNLLAMYNINNSLSCAACRAPCDLAYDMCINHVRRIDYLVI